uniref:Uncharacterized protein n=1 Tax=Arundo donax TaxID=35708 RepID=A0A0A9FUG3_ARUDO
MDVNNPVLSFFFVLLFLKLTLHYIISPSISFDTKYNNTYLSHFVVQKYHPKKVLKLKRISFCS